jgi:hypothetical protein
MRTNALSVWALAALIGMAAVGCGTPRPKPVAWNVTVVKKTPATITVDLIGITPSEKSGWEGYSMDKYWQDPQDLRRKDADKITQLLELNKPWVVPRDDPMWQRWLSRGATELMVLADLPGHWPAGVADPRRKFFTLNKKAWNAHDATLEFEVLDTDVRAMTPEVPR